MGDVDRGDVEGFEAEGVGEMDSQGGSADGEMNDLPDGGVAQIVRGHGVLGFGDLLRSSPARYPDL